VHLLHFENLKKDMPGEIRQVADFLGIAVDESKWPDILKHCSFDYMKANATASVPLGGAFWDGGAQTFINKGVNGRWREVLSAEENAAYEKRAVAELGDPCARWLAKGAQN
jgi:aryl sulfotransferase